MHMKVDIFLKDFYFSTFFNILKTASESCTDSSKLWKSVILKQEETPLLINNS